MTGGELGRQRAENARKKRQLASSTLTLGDDPDLLTCVDWTRRARGRLSRRYVDSLIGKKTGTAPRARPATWNNRDYN